MRGASHSRARHIDAPAVSEARVAYIADMMRKCEYHRGKSPAALSEAWDITPTDVRRLAAEASRIVMAELNDPDRVVVDINTTLDNAMKGALEAKDWKGAVAACELAAKLAGLMPMGAKLTVNNIGGVHGQAQFSSASEMLYWIDSMRPKLLEAAAQEAEKVEESHD